MTNEFGKFIEELRGKMTLRQAAEKSNLSHTYIRDLELGYNRKTKAPIAVSHDTVRRLAAAYNYDYEELLKKAGILDENNNDVLSTSERIIKEIVAKYNIDLSVPGNREKLEQIVQLVLVDRQSHK